MTDNERERLQRMMDDVEASFRKERRNKLIIAVIIQLVASVALAYHDQDLWTLICVLLLIGANNIELNSRKTVFKSSKP